MRTQSMPIQLIAASLVLAVGMFAASAAAAAVPVYKWTDSAGHSHYSQTPPEGQKYKTITASDAPARSAPAPDNAPADAPQQASGPTKGQIKRQLECDTARSNVETLSNNASVKLDINGDGKPDVLTGEQQKEQLENASKQVSLYCDK